MKSVNSRYVESAVNQDGSNIVVSSRLPASPARYTTHLVKEGESFESIASWSLGSPERWWEIADINTHVKYPNFLRPGTSIRIPSL